MGCSPMNSGWVSGKLLAENLWKFLFQVSWAPLTWNFPDVCGEIKSDHSPQMARLGSLYGITGSQWVNILRPRQNGRHLTDDIFKYIFLKENVWISITISLKFVLKGLIDNIPSMIQIMAWHRPGDKPLSEPMMVRLPTHIYVTRPQWVKHWKG